LVRLLKKCNAYKVRKGTLYNCWCQYFKKFMKRLLLLFLLIPTLVLGQRKEKELKERIDYFKSHPIFVTQLTLDQKAIMKLTEKEIEAANLKIEKTNKNIRIAFTKFWDINDTVIFVLDTVFGDRCWIIQT